MVIASKVYGQLTTLFIGLNAEDIRKLQGNTPVMLYPDSYSGLPKQLAVAMVGGLSDQAIVDSMIKAGLIDQSTNIDRVKDKPHESQNQDANSQTDRI